MVNSKVNDEIKNSSYYDLISRRIVATLEATVESLQNWELDYEKGVAFDIVVNDNRIQFTIKNRKVKEDE